MKPLTKIDEQVTNDGLLQLLKRGDNDFIIKLDNQILMNSQLNLTEVALATDSVAILEDRRAPRVLVSGLGMGCTLKAALAALPSDAKVIVAELNPIIATWCKGPLAPLSDQALADPRVQLVVGDAVEIIREAAWSKVGKYDAIILDMYEGTSEANRDPSHPFYGLDALRVTRRALKKDGVFAVWTEGKDQGFFDRLGQAGFKGVETRPGKGGPRHVVYLATMIKK